MQQAEVALTYVKLPLVSKDLVDKEIIVYLFNNALTLFLRVGLDSAFDI
jgi:hypothetical protein